jgi:hypothetical protein
LAVARGFQYRQHQRLVVWYGHSTLEGMVQPCHF